MHVRRVDVNAASNEFRLPGAAGYTAKSYALSLSGFGTPYKLSASGTWILFRKIPHSIARDAMACYPLLCCQNWRKLKTDLDTISDNIVSMVGVTDPFGEYTIDLLRDSFADLVRPFKQHFVVNLQEPMESFVAPHHHRNARKALHELHVERVVDAVSLLDDWLSLYGRLVQRHSIRGIAAFSKGSFGRQLQVPGVHCFRAVRDNEAVGINIWYQANDIAYYHLGAYSDEGYRLRASFALFWRAIDYFAINGLQWLDLGAGAGAIADTTDGLSRFKRGWANTTRIAYLCGRIFDRDMYRQLTAAREQTGDNYFPAYRKGEFV